MPKQTITITLDLPREYEPVAEFRPPKNGEEILYGSGIVGAVDADVPTPCIVLTRKWEWPKWLGGKRIRPGNIVGEWFLETTNHCAIFLDPETFPWFVPPPDGKPRTNPKYKQEN